MKGVRDYLVSIKARHFSIIGALTEGIFQELLFLQPTYTKLEGAKWSLRFLYLDKSVSSRFSFTPWRKGGGWVVVRSMEYRQINTHLGHDHTLFSIETQNRQWIKFPSLLWLTLYFYLEKCPAFPLKINPLKAHLASVTSLTVSLGTI